MRKVLLASLVICMLALLSTLSISVHATPPTPASGTWTYEPTVEITKVADGNMFMSGDEVSTYQYGTFVGTSYDVFTAVVHPSGFVTCEGLISFSGTVGENGESGTMVILFVGKQSAETGLWSGQWVILSGTEGLANLHGQGTWGGPGFPNHLVNPGEPDLWYSGQIHFDPA